MTTGERLAREAEKLEGTPFRLRGRDAATGVDCVGVVAVALARIGHAAALPQAYTLKQRDPGALAEKAAACGFAPAEGDGEAGDVVMVQVAPCQIHCVVQVCDGHFVHAHAGLRKVVRSRHLPEGTIIARWRLTT